MLSLDFIYQHPQIVSEGLQRRGEERGVEEILQLVEQKKALVARCDGLYVLLKREKDSIRKASGEERAKVNERVKAIGRDLRPLELQVTDIDARLQPLLMRLPNMPHQSVIEGVRREGEGEVR